MSDLAFSAKGEGSFPHKGQSLRALRVSSMELLSGLRQTGLSRRCVLFCFTKEDRRSAQHLLNTSRCFRPLNSLTVKEKRCERPVLNWWVLARKPSCQFVEDGSNKQKKRGQPRCLESWELNSSHRRSDASYLCWAALRVVSACLCPRLQLMYKFWRDFQDSLLHKGDMVQEEKEWEFTWNSQFPFHV